MKEQDIVQQFQDLQSEAKKHKVAIELDPSVDGFVDSLFEPYSWHSLTNVILPTITQNEPLRYCNYLLPTEDLVKVLNRMFQEDYRFFPEVLGKFLSQSEEIKEPKLWDAVNSFIASLEGKGALKIGKEVFELCHGCGFVRIVEEENSRERCEICDSSLFKIFETYAPDLVRQNIKEHQFLEIYVKKCLQRAGFKLITKKVGDNEIATSIPYKVFGNDVEIDVSSVAGSNLLIFECRTTKLTQTDFNQKLSQIRDLLVTVKDRLGGLPDVHVFFVTTDRIHESVAPESYISAYDFKNVKAYICKDLPTLCDELRNYKKKLSR
jgi:hypothetical protein